MAYKLGCGWCRPQPGKLPTASSAKSTPWSTAATRSRSTRRHARARSVLLVDDLLATGGTALAAARLVESWGKSAGRRLPGRAGLPARPGRLTGYNVHSYVHY